MGIGGKRKDLEEKVALENIKAEGWGGSMKEYLNKVRWAVVILFVVAFLTHGSILFSQRIGIDTDLMMHGEHNFLRIGRQGLVWLAKLLDLDWFNLYHAQVLSFLLIVLLPVSYGYLFHRALGQADGSTVPGLLALGFSVIVSPFWVEQMYFLNQSAQVLLAALMIPMSILLADRAVQDIRHKWYCAVFSVALMQLIFSSYQILVVMYVVSVAAFFLFSAARRSYTAARFARWTGFHAAVFGVGVLIYSVISRLLFMSGGNYLESQIAWKTGEFGEILQECLSEVGDSLKNNPPYYTGMYGVFCLVLLGVTLYQMIAAKRLKTQNSVLILIVELFLIFSPYIFIFYYGGALPPRVQLIMPLSQGAVLYLTIAMLCEEKRRTAGKKALLAKAVSFVLVVGLYRDTVWHLNYCNRFYYTDEWAYQFDLRVIDEVYADIRDAMEDLGLDEEYDQILFLGDPEVPYNPTCLRGNVIGVSAFQWDIKTDRPYRDRVAALLKHTGHSLNMNFTAEQIQSYRAHFFDDFGKQVDEMPSYPSEGYIQYLSKDETGLNYLVIKLGEDWRPMETEK